MKLIFVYNVSATKAVWLLASAHKFFSPNTYKCDLCNLTFGVFSEKKKMESLQEIFKSGNGFSSQRSIFKTVQI